MYIFARQIWTVPIWRSDVESEQEYRAEATGQNEFLTLRRSICEKRGASGNITAYAGGNFKYTADGEGIHEVALSGESCTATRSSFAAVGSQVNRECHLRLYICQLQRQNAVH